MGILLRVLNVGYFVTYEVKTKYLVSPLPLSFPLSLPPSLPLSPPLSRPSSPGEADSEHFQNTWASVWVKMSTVWLCFAVYVWTLVAPLVLGKCRDFDYVQE